MKKLLATMLMGVVAVAAIAQTAVYDYKATFKRIDPIYKLRTVDPDGAGSLTKAQYVTESYGVKSDTITGYVVLPICLECLNGILESSEDFTVTQNTNFYPFAYLVRKGDTLTKKAWPGDTVTAKYVAKVPVFAKAAIFKSTVFTVPMTGSSTPAVSVPKTMSAWMTLDYEIPTASGAFLNPGHVIAKAASNDPANMLIYGFLGLDNNYGNWDVWDVYYAGEGYVLNKGFGTASIVTTSTPGSIGVCSANPGSSSSCNIITSISGSTVGEFGYQGPCGTTPMSSWS
ncbi:MAG TPA: hypothetical protein PKY10_15720, partial [Lentisphaeria bacterium]|nr:hypothetical protein [Lentisphaeria bacterium]